MRIFYGFAKWLPKKDDQKEGRLWQKSWNVSFSQNYMLIKAIFFFFLNIYCMPRNVQGILHTNIHACSVSVWDH